MLTHLLFVSTIFSFLASEAWQEVSFPDIDPNSTSYHGGVLRVEVDHSASPLLHLFSERKEVRSLRITGRVSGDWKFSTSHDWSASPDDALLRVGLIENGNRRLNALEKLAAPNWLKDLDKATQSFGNGIGTIRCFHLMPEKKWIGQTRTNPNADIFLETVAASPSEDGAFEIEVQLDSPIESLGIWLLADGDDSGASFTVEIHSLELNLVP
ncbi:MAG: hypothetical protein AAF491_07805 [Verrucomicrobiota bacterium]